MPEITIFNLQIIKFAELISIDPNPDSATGVLISTVLNASPDNTLDIMNITVFNVDTV